MPPHCFGGGVFDRGGRHERGGVSPPIWRSPPEFFGRAFHEPVSSPGQMLPPSGPVAMRSREAGEGGPAQPALPAHARRESRVLDPQLRERLLLTVTSCSPSRWRPPRSTDPTELALVRPPRLVTAAPTTARIRLPGTEIRSSAICLQLTLLAELRNAWPTRPARAALSRHSPAWTADLTAGHSGLSTGLHGQRCQSTTGRRRSAADSAEPLIPS